MLSYVRIKQLWLRKILPIFCAPTLHGIPFIAYSSLCLVALRQWLFILKHMIIHSRILLLKGFFSLFRCAFYRLIKLIRKMPWDINQPQVCPVISIPLDVPATQNRSFLRSLWSLQSFSAIFGRFKSFFRLFFTSDSLDKIVMTFCLKSHLFISSATSHPILRRSHHCSCYGDTPAPPMIIVFILVTSPVRARRATPPLTAFPPVPIPPPKHR